MTTSHVEIDRAPVAPFRLKEFLNAGPAANARASLSSSFAELTSLATLAQWDATLMDRIQAFSGAYPGAHGSLDLRTAIADLLGLEPDEIIVTNGADEAIELVGKGLLESGDVVSVVDPAYGPLRSLAQQRGARVVGVPLDEAAGWELGDAGWEALLPPGVRLVELNVPHNPTGWMPADGELTAFIARAQAAHALVLFDEIYAGLDPEDPGGFRCLAAEHPGTISVGALSKAFGLPGLCVGWIASRNAPVMKRLATLRQHANSFVSRLSEIAALSALASARQILTRNIAIARANQDELIGFCARQPGLWSLVAPAVGVVAFARWLGPGSATELSRRTLADLQMLIVPGELFDFGDRHVRFGFGAATFGRNLAAFADYLASYR
jgi:aspartate/methionine/tyrosine aminotransferase